LFEQTPFFLFMRPSFHVFLPSRTFPLPLFPQPLMPKKKKKKKRDRERTVKWGLKRRLPRKGEVPLSHEH
jgi:hypothetical protein